MSSYLVNNMTQDQKQGISLSNLTAAKTIMICAILICAGIAAYLGANVSLSFSIEARLYALENQINVPVNSTLSAFIKSSTYIINRHDVSGTTYYCLWNGTGDRAGKLEDYSTNASQIINFGLANASAIKGTVFLKSGLYSLDSPILVQSNTCLRGESRDGTILQMQVGLNWTCIIMGASAAYPVPTTPAYNITVMDLTVDGQYPLNAKYGSTGMPAEANQTGIGPRNLVNGLIENCMVINQPWNGIQPYGNCSDLTIEDNWIETFGFLGIEVWGANLAPGIVRCEITNNHILNSLSTGGGIKTEYYVSFSTISSNVINGSGTGITAGMTTFDHDDTYSFNTIYSSASYGLFAMGGTYADSFIGNIVEAAAQRALYASNVANTTFVGNTFQRDNSGSCVDIAASSSNLIISQNYIYGTGTYVTNAGTNIKIYENIGFVTENSISGSNTTATSAVINHGLASNATYAFCYFNDSAISGYTVTSTSTQITVTIAGTPSGNWTCYAKVEYRP